MSRWSRRKWPALKYIEAIQLVALNDEPRVTDQELMRGMISIMLVSDIYRMPVERVIFDILRYRKDTSK